MPALLGGSQLGNLLLGGSGGANTLSLGDEIALYLQGQTLSTPLNFDGAGEINLFSTFMPDEPDLAAVVIERGGLPPLMMLQDNPFSKLDQPVVQVRVRASMQGYADGNALIESIFKALHNLSEIVLNPGHALFHLIYAMQSPVYLGTSPTTDARQRHMWSINFRLLWENDQR